MITGVMTIVLAAAVPLRWTVETSRAQPVVFEAYHGEELALEASFNSYGTPLELSGTPQLFWQTNGMGSAWWSTNAAVVATNRVRATFTGAMDAGADAVRGFLGFAGTNYRAAFALRLHASPGWEPAAIEWPYRMLDFEQIEVRNAPYYTKSETEAAIVAGVERGSIKTNEVNALIGLYDATNIAPRIATNAAQIARVAARCETNAAAIATNAAQIAAHTAAIAAHTAQIALRTTVDDVDDLVAVRYVGEWTCAVTNLTGATIIDNFDLYRTYSGEWVFEGGMNYNGKTFIPEHGWLNWLGKEASVNELAKVKDWSDGSGTTLTDVCFVARRNYEANRYGLATTNALMAATDYALTNATGTTLTLASGTIANLTLSAVQTNLYLTMTYPADAARSCDAVLRVANAAETHLAIANADTVVDGSAWETLAAGTNYVTVTRTAQDGGISTVMVVVKEVE